MVDTFIFPALWYPSMCVSRAGWSLIRCTRYSNTRTHETWVMITDSFTFEGGIKALFGRCEYRTDFMKGPFSDGGSYSSTWWRCVSPESCSNHGSALQILQEPHDKCDGLGLMGWVDKLKDLPCGRSPSVPEYWYGMHGYAPEYHNCTQCTGMVAKRVWWHL